MIDRPFASWEDSGNPMHAGSRILAYSICTSIVFACSNSSAQKIDQTTRLIECGDILGVFVDKVLGSLEQGIPSLEFDDPEQTSRYGYPLRVCEDGTVSIPEIGDILAEGNSLSEFRDLIRHRVAELKGIAAADGRAREDVVVTMIRAKPDEEELVYRAKCGDVLALFIPGVTTFNPAHSPPAHLHANENLRPCIGHPFPVDEMGKLNCRLIEPIDVVGLTLNEIEQRLFEALTVDVQILNPDHAIIVVSPMWVTNNDERDAEPYRIQPGDSIAVVDTRLEYDKYESGNPRIYDASTQSARPFWGVPYSVTKDGFLDYPNMEPIEVEGLTLSEIEQLLDDYWHQHPSSSPILLPEEPKPTVWQIKEMNQSRIGFDGDYCIQLGDTLCIDDLPGSGEREQAFYFPSDERLGPAYGEMVSVLPDGMIHLPSGGTIVAVDRTCDDLKRAITDHMLQQELCGNHEVDVSVIEMSNGMN